MTLMTSYLYRSVLFNCSTPDLSCCPFAEISPEVILRLGVRNGCVLFDMKRSFYYKTAWMGFCNHTHTVLDFKKIISVSRGFRLRLHRLPTAFSARPLLQLSLPIQLL